MLLEDDTIVAVSTPPGRGGIGIVRLSGTEAVAIASPLLRLRHALAPGHARFGVLLDEAGQTLDEAVVTFFAAPHSYTAQDVVEIAAHGSPVLLDYVVRSCMGRGARLAEPGEFTQRAFLSGRLDLTQAEGVHDLIAAQTLQQARVAASQLGGFLARTIEPVKQQLVDLIATLEAGVDFAEDDIDLLPAEEIVKQLGAIAAPLRALAATYGYGRVVRDGFTLAIAGRPNAGKSSLFNRLLAQERAIVTAQPGTTRDPISERLAIDGIPVELIDTAGLRDQAEGEAERLGIERSRRAMADADLVLLVVDASTIGSGQALDPYDLATLTTLQGRRQLVVLNKMDLLPPGLGAEAAQAAWIRVSALTGEGLAELKAAIVHAVAGTTAAAADSAMLTNLRQHEAIGEACSALQTASAAGMLPHEFLLLDLHRALDALDRLTGQTSTDDILSAIFAKFCIGK